MHAMCLVASDGLTASYGLTQATEMSLQRDSRAMKWTGLPSVPYWT
jgi:hypothetical protein